MSPYRWGANIITWNVTLFLDESWTSRYNIVLPSLSLRPITVRVLRLPLLLETTYVRVKKWHFDIMKLSDDSIRTRSNRYRLLQKHCHYDFKKKLNFSNNVIPVWNSLSDYLCWVVCAETVNTFKNRLDSHWSDKEVFYDYNADLHAIANRSIMLKDSSLVISRI